MKLLLIAIFLIAWSMPGLAEVFDPLPHCYGEPGLIRVPCGEHELSMLLDRKRCAALMEQAMRKMDTSMPQFFRKINLSGRTYWEFTDQLTEAQAKAYWTMLDQWDAAKRECWATPSSTP